LRSSIGSHRIRWLGSGQVYGKAGDGTSSGKSRPGALSVQVEVRGLSLGEWGSPIALSGLQERSFIGNHLRQVRIRDSDSEASSLPGRPLAKFRRPAEGDAPRPFLRSQLQCRGQPVLIPHVVNLDPPADICECGTVVAAVVVHGPAAYLGVKGPDIPGLRMFVARLCSKNRPLISAPDLCEVIDPALVPEPFV
jgi:hypothetical protein